MSVAESSVEHKVADKFEAELIDRFFNPRSYFLHNFLTTLRKREPEIEDPLRMVIMGLIVDQIINADDKFLVLRQFDRYPEFRRFHEQLEDGIRLLKDSRLSTQQMMDVVGALGKSLAEALVELVQQETNRDELLQMLGLESERPAAQEPEPEPQPELELPQEDISAPVTEEVVEEELTEEISEEEPVTAPQKEDVLSELSAEPAAEGVWEEPWSFFKEDMQRKLHVLQQHLASFARHPNDWKIFRQIKDDFRDLRDWSMIQGDEGIEAISHKILLLFEAVYAKGIEHRYRILPILQDAADTLELVNNAGRGSERLDIVRVMVHQIDKQRKIYPQILTDEQVQHSADAEPEKAPAASPVLEETIETSTEYVRTQEIIAPEPEEEEIIFPAQTPSSTEEEPLTSQVQLEESLREEIRSHEEEKEAADKPQNNAQPAEEEIDETFKSIRESELLSELVSEHGEELDDLEIPGIKDDAEKHEESAGLAESAPDEGEDLPLPGEDDEDLMSILTELKQEQERYQEKEGPAEMEDSFGVSKFDEYIEKMEEEYSRQIQDESGQEEIPAPAPEPVSQKQEKPPAEPEPQPEPEELSSGNGLDFVSEADMYFTFGRKALHKLMKNPTDRQSLEDVELACYSLKILSDKLGYKRVSRVLGLAERLVQGQITSKSGLNPEQVNMLIMIVHEIEEAGRGQSLNDPARLSWLAKQEAILKNWVSGEQKALSGNEEPENGTKGGEKSSKSEDPLDFLLLDDSSKFFKQLLSE